MAGKIHSGGTVHFRLRGTDGYIDLWASFHYKSSIITFAGVIQEVMCDPEITVAIFSVTRPIAAKFLHQIKEEFEQNLTLKLAYANTFRPRSRMLLKVMKGGLGGVITPWVILGGGSLSPGSISALRVTWDAASWLLAEKWHSEMQHSPLPPTTCSWIAEC